MKQNKLEDFNSFLTFNADEFTPSGSHCYFKEKADSEMLTMLPTTPLKEIFNLRWYIQYLIDECESGYNDDDFENPLHEQNWSCQTRRKLMKYIIYNGKGWTHKHLDKSAVRPITKANPNHKSDTGEWESGTPTGS